MSIYFNAIKIKSLLIKVLLKKPPALLGLKLIFAH